MHCKLSPFRKFIFTKIMKNFADCLCLLFLKDRSFFTNYLSMLYKYA